MKDENDDVSFTDPEDFVRVVYLKTPKTEGDEGGEVFAFFPDEKWNDSDNVSYAHCGQHGPCALEYAKECTAATKEEYEGLDNELRDIGYVTMAADAVNWLKE